MDRYCGFYRALLEYGKPLKEQWVLEDRDVLGNIRIHLPEKMPEAFVCNCDLTAGTLIQLLEEKGLKVPQDVSVVGFDNYSYPEFQDRRITTYEVDTHKMAQLALLKLIRRLNHPNAEHSLEVVPGSISEASRNGCQTHVAAISDEQERERMVRSFNVTGSCNPQFHYMVNIQDKLKEIKALVDSGAYFTINRARQYGKTTTIRALVEYLKKEYIILSLDFQMIGNEEFENADLFSKAFARYILRIIHNKRFPITGFHGSVLHKLLSESENKSLFSLRRLFELLSDLCDRAEKPVVMIIDEVDSATNNQVFLDFLSQLRGYYLKRDELPTFQSVILSGVYDVKNIKWKIHPDEKHRVNSPWNIATDFLVNMSFSKDGISGMLADYETDHHTGMDIDKMAGMIYDSTSGYPFLVSKICKLMDERIAGSDGFPDKVSAWTKEGYLEAEKMLTQEKNTLFDSLTGKLIDYPELKKMLAAILFDGKNVSYVSSNSFIETAFMFGFVKKEHNMVVVSNRIFETVLYNQFLSEEEVDSLVYACALSEKNQFIQGGKLNMKLILERFVQVFMELYEDKDERFREEIGRKYFMLFLKPIINGTGHSYIEARTRNMKRTDIIVDYKGEQFVVELKIWRGANYHAEGERQIAEYLDYYGLKKGYLLTFCFNKNKVVGVTERQYGDRILVEAIV